MRLEERIVLNAAGMTADGPDSGHAGWDHGATDGGGATPAWAHPGGDAANHVQEANADNTQSMADPPDRAGHTGPDSAAKGTFENAAQSTDAREAASGLRGLLDGLLGGFSDVLNRAADTVRGLFQRLSESVGQHFGVTTDGMTGPDPGADLPVDSMDPVGSLDGNHLATSDAEHSPSPEAEDGVRVLAVSSSVDQAEVLASAARQDVLAVVFDAANPDLDVLSAQLRDLLGDQHAASIALATNGLGNGRFELAGGIPVDLDTLHNPEMEAFWRGLADLLAPEGRIDLLACDAAAGPEGHALLDALENLTGADFAASTDKTGNVSRGG